MNSDKLVFPWTFPRTGFHSWKWHSFWNSSRIPCLAYVSLCPCLGWVGFRSGEKVLGGWDGCLWLCPWCLWSSILNGWGSPHCLWEWLSFCFIRSLHTEWKWGEITGSVWNSDGLGCLCNGNLSSWSLAGLGVRSGVRFWSWEGTREGGERGYLGASGVKSQCLLSKVIDIVTTKLNSWILGLATVRPQRSENSE